jgi:hypothetical protein
MARGYSQSRSEASPSRGLDQSSRTKVSKIADDLFAIRLSSETALKAGENPYPGDEALNKFKEAFKAYQDFKKFIEEENVKNPSEKAAKALADFNKFYPVDERRMTGVTYAIKEFAELRALSRRVEYKRMNGSGPTSREKTKLNQKWSADLTNKSHIDASFYIAGTALKGIAKISEEYAS